MNNKKGTERELTKTEAALAAGGNTGGNATGGDKVSETSSVLTAPAIKEAEVAVKAPKIESKPEVKPESIPEKPENTENSDNPPPPSSIVPGSDEEADSEVRGRLAASPQYEGFTDMLPRIDALIEKYPAFASLPSLDKYCLAYLAVLGSNTARGGKNAAKTPEQLVRDFTASPEAVKLYESKRVLEQNEKARGIPLFSANAGRANIPANVRPEPKNFEEATAASYKILGIEKK
jgi:hypothetical protein